MVNTIPAMFRVDAQIKLFFTCPRCSFTPTLHSDVDATSFIPYFRSSLLPSPDESVDIRKRLAAVQAEQSRLKQERQKLEAALRQVDGELRRLGNIAAGLTGTVSRLRHFPTEILQSIFELALPNHDYTESKQRQNCPWTISYVCSRWRRIAVSTPTLWTRISPPSCDWCLNEPTRSTEKLLGLYIERSQGLPLKFALSNSSAHIGTFGTDTCYTCQLLVQLSPRIRHLIYSVDHHNHWDTGLRPSFPQLYSVCGYLDVTTIFRDAPLLKAADFLFRDHFSSLQFPWAQLTYLNLEVEGVMEEASLLGVLRQCVDLVFFGLTVEYHDHGSDQGEESTQGNEVAKRQPVTLPRLRVLHAVNIPLTWSSEPGLLLQVISSLRCPGLESLTIVDPDDGYRQFVVDSHCQETLVELFIGHPSGNLGESTRTLLLRLLDELVNIEVLTLYVLPRRGPLTFSESVIDEICALYRHSDILDPERLRVVRGEDFYRPPSYIGNNGKLWRNSFSVFLHQSWHSCAEPSAYVYAKYAQHRCSISQTLPQRCMGEIHFPEFVDEYVSTEVVRQSGFKYLCIVCTV